MGGQSAGHVVVVSPGSQVPFGHIVPLDDELADELELSALELSAVDSALEDSDVLPAAPPLPLPPYPASGFSRYVNRLSPSMLQPPEPAQMATTTQPPSVHTLRPDGRALDEGGI